MQKTNIKKDLKKLKNSGQWSKITGLMSHHVKDKYLRGVKKAAWLIR